MATKKIIYEIYCDGVLVAAPTYVHADAVADLQDHVDAYPEDLSQLEFRATKTGHVVFSLTGQDLREFVQDLDPPVDEDDDYFDDSYYE